MKACHFLPIIRSMDRPFDPLNGGGAHRGPSRLTMTLGQTARRLPGKAVVAGLCVAGLTVVVWDGVRTQQRSLLAADAHQRASSAVRSTVIQMNDLALALARLHDRWTPACPEGPACQRDLTTYLRDFPAIQRLGWVGSEGTAVAFRPSARPVETIEADQSTASTEQLMQAAARHRGGAQLVWTGGEPQLALAVTTERQSPVLVAILDMQQLFDATARNPAEAMELAVGARRAAVSGGGTLPSPSEGLATESTDLLGQQWAISVAPRSRPAGWSTADLLLASGLLIAMFVGTSLTLWQSSQEFAEQVVVLNAEIEQRAEARQREQDDQLHQILDSVRLAPWTLELASGRLHGHREMKRLFGLAPGGHLATLADMLRLVHPDDRAALQEATATAVANRSEYSVEFRVVWPDSTTHWLLGRGRVACDAEGVPTHMRGITVDVSARKEAEFALHESRRRFTESLEESVAQRTAELVKTNLELGQTRARLQGVLDAATQVSIISADTDGIIRVFNKGAERMLGYSADEMIGHAQPQAIHLPSEVQARAAELSQEFGRRIEGFDVFVEYARRGHFDERDWTYVRKDGTTLDVRLVVTAVRNQDCDILGSLGIALDVTEQRRLERELKRNLEELREQTLQAQEANRAKSQFLAAMSHEIRTPMNAILAMADLLSESPLTEEQREYVGLFRAAGGTLMSLIDDLLDLSKIESGRFELEHTGFRIDQLLERCIALVEPKARAKGLKLALEQSSALPTDLVGDPTRLHQVLLNLLSNAVKFTDRGKVTLRATAPPGALPGTISFAVSDTGIGIPADKFATIFEDFRQADSSTTRHYGGTGLGLAISRRIVERLGGRLEVASVVGEGSTFRFQTTFQLGQPATAVLPAVEGALTVPDDAAPAPLRILVADDVETNRTVVRAFLKATPHTLVFVENGLAAVEQMTRHAFDVVLMDVHMPVMDGLSATRAIRSLEAEEGRPRAFILALTASATTEDARAAREAGCDGHLTKPVSKQRLLDALSAAPAGQEAAGVSR